MSEGFFFHKNIFLNINLDTFLSNKKFINSWKVKKNNYIHKNYICKDCHRCQSEIHEMRMVHMILEGNFDGCFILNFLRGWKKHHKEADEVPCNWA
jgi:hypothetical protein